MRLESLILRRVGAVRPCLTSSVQRRIAAAFPFGGFLYAPRIEPLPVRVEPLVVWISVHLVIELARGLPFGSGLLASRYIGQDSLLQLQLVIGQIMAVAIHCA